MYLVVFMVSLMAVYHCTYVFSDVHGYYDGAVLPVHMYLVVFMFSVMALCHLHICI